MVFQLKDKMKQFAVLTVVSSILIGCAREEPPADVVMAESASPYHIVAKGETLSAIASQHGTTKANLVRINRLKSPYRIFVGQKLIAIPSGGEESLDAKIQKPAVKAVTSVADTGEVTVEELPADEKDNDNNAALPTLGSGVPSTSASLAGQAVSGAEGLATTPLGAVGAVSGSNSDSESSAAETPEAIESPKKAVAPESSGTLHWPAQGQVIKSFGTDAKGQRNDGINIAVPAGTPVGAADNGVVAHVGNQARGFGNLVLVKHAAGKISVYGHLQEASVKVGDKVAAGQQIGLAGTSGGVSQSQVHFELRQGKKPLNPAEYLK